MNNDNPEQRPTKNNQQTNKKIKKIKPVFDYENDENNDDYYSIKNDPDRCRIPKNIDELSNEQRMKALIAEVKVYRRINSPDTFSVAMLWDFINQMRKIYGFSEEEMKYAINQVYSKRVKRHEHLLIQLGIQN